MWPERIVSTAFLIACCLSLSVSPLAAQQLSRLADFRVLAGTLEHEIAARLPGAEADSVKKIKPTYWVEGALIGGATLGVLAGVVAGGFCADPDSNTTGGPCWDNVLLGTVFGFAVGGSVGALIGGQFNKAAEDEPEESQPEAETQE